MADTEMCSSWPALRPGAHTAAAASGAAQLLAISNVTAAWALLQLGASAVAATEKGAAHGCCCKLWHVDVPAAASLPEPSLAGHCCLLKSKLLHRVCRSGGLPEGLQFWLPLSARCSCRRPQGLRKAAAPPGGCCSTDAARQAAAIRHCLLQNCSRAPAACWSCTDCCNEL